MGLLQLVRRERGDRAGLEHGLRESRGDLQVESLLIRRLGAERPERHLPVTIAACGEPDLQYAVRWCRDAPYALDPDDESLRLVARDSDTVVFAGRAPGWQTTGPP